jgi:hypothetical protein
MLEMYIHLSFAAAEDLVSAEQLLPVVRLLGVGWPDELLIRKHIYLKLLQKLKVDTAKINWYNFLL